MPRTVRRVGRMFGQRGPRAPLKERQLALIQRVPCLAALNEPQRMCAVEMLSLREYAHGTKITREGEVGDEFFMIDRGQVVLTVARDDRGQGHTKELSKLKAGDYFGDDIVLAGRYTSTATAIGTVNVHVMHRTSLENVLAPVTKEVRDAASESEILKQVPLLSHLKAKDRAGLITHLLPVAYPPNAYVCRQGERGETFYIILSGVCKVLITQSKDSGAAEIEVQRLGAGDFFGEMALMRSDSLRTANIVTVTPVKCMVLHNTHFQQFRPQLELLLLQHGAGNSNKLRLSGPGAGGGAGETGLLADITRRNSLADTAMLAMIVASDKKQARALQKAEHLMERQSFNFASLMLKESGGVDLATEGTDAGKQKSLQSKRRAQSPAKATAGLIRSTSVQSFGNSTERSAPPTLTIPETSDAAFPASGGLSPSPHSPGKLRVGGHDEARRVSRRHRGALMQRRSIQHGSSTGPMHVPFAETPLHSPHSVIFDITSLQQSLFSKLSRRLSTDPDIGTRFPRILPLLDRAATADAAAMAEKFANRLQKAHSFTQKAHSYGSRLRLSHGIRPSMQQRRAHMSAIGQEVCTVLSLPSQQRDTSAINFLWELLKATEFIAKFCKGWSKHQIQELMHELQVKNFEQRTLVYDESSLADSAYIILAGSFVVSSGRGHNGRVAKLGPGESFGDMALLGMPARMSRVMAVTSATCAVVPANVYSTLVGSIPVEQKFEFLQSLPLFRDWDPYKLYKVAVVLRERRFARNTLLLRANERANGIFFVKEGEVVYTHGRVVGVQQLSQRGALAEGNEGYRGSDALGDVGMDAALISGSEAEQSKQRQQQKQRLVEVAADQRIRRRKWEREELDSAGKGSATASEDPSPAAQKLRKITTHRCCTAGRVTLRRAHKDNTDCVDVPVLERGAVNENRSLIPLCTLTSGSMFGESAVATTLEVPNPKVTVSSLARKNAFDRRNSVSARDREGSVSIDAKERRGSTAAIKKDSTGPSTADDTVALREPAAVAVLDNSCLLLQLLPDDCRALLDAATMAKMDAVLQEKHARLGHRGTAQKAARRVRRQHFDESIKQPWIKLRPTDGGNDRASTAPPGRRKVSAAPRRVAAADIVVKPRGCDAYTLARLPRDKARRVLSASMSIDKLMASSSPGDQGMKSLEKQRRARQSTLAASGIMLPGATRTAGRSGRQSMQRARLVASQGTQLGNAPTLGLSTGPTQIMHAAAEMDMRRAVHKLNAQGNTLLAIKEECRELGQGVSAALGASAATASSKAARTARGALPTSPTALYNNTSSPSSAHDMIDRDPRAGTYLVRQN